LPYDIAVSWLHDIRLAGRGIRRSSGFFATAALLLSAAGVLVGLAVSFLAMRTLRGARRAWIR
jgi:hypothetical protein